MPPKTLIIIPTYNEMENLPRLLDTLAERVPFAHVLIVDDGSPDGTGDFAEKRAASDGRVFVMHREGKLGLGTAYIEGFKWALLRDYSLVIQMDADFSHDPEVLWAFIDAAERADLVLGSRWVAGGGTIGWPLRRQLISRGGSWYARTVLGVGVRDLTGGFKCWHRRVLAALDLDGIVATGFGFQIEMTYRAIRQGFKVVEVPVRFADRTRGQSKMSSSIFVEALSLVWKLRLDIRS